MNLLNNKELLRNLLIQGDQLNTLSGGVSQVTMDVRKQEDGFAITVHAPGISAEHLKVISDVRSLQIYATLSGFDEGSTPAILPVFYRKLDLPIFANTDDIEAVYHESNLEIFIPIGRNNTGNKKEIEIKQI
ncbi:hypothetical protein GCM10011506_12470 [Marivirga lumbricoides]|uniref:SHSP domain-containing protein n=1 Tax=Marivirga lumbricoides TaxID=1046115 RepID=A0A2T4DD31_9BACT|nr:hypothetical protein C9994_15025 [Marivirga lumbricoides]GGC28630.1 hypothetical protein GCM10011506_12470 [Marivirga lumbricoides]